MFGLVQPNKSEGGPTNQRNKKTECSPLSLQN